MSSDDATVSSFTPAFGNRFSSLLEVIGGLRAASTIIGVTDEQIGRWRNGKAKPPFFALAQLCEATGVSLDWLATGQGHMLREPAPFDVGLPLPQQEPAASLDEELLTTVMREVETWLESRRKRLPADKKAEVVALIYDMVLKEKAGGGETNPAREVGRILRLVA